MRSDCCYQSVARRERGSASEILHQMTTMSMDLDRILITFYAAILALLLASGNII